MPISVLPCVIRIQTWSSPWGQSTKGMPNVTIHVTVEYTVGSKVTD